MSYTASMQGRRCLVTGATSGHGRAVAVALARAGAQVVVHGRDKTRCEAVCHEIQRLPAVAAPESLLCDLADLDDVQRAADRLLADGRPLHVLVNNAGLVKAHRAVTAQGHELTFGVNHLACFSLTLRLVNRLRESHPSRVIIVASDMHRVARLDLDDLMGQRSYSALGAYGRSKLAMVHFTAELAARLTGAGVTVNAVDPGPVASRIADREPGLIARAASALLPYVFPSPEKAAATAVYLASAPELLHANGGYYKFGRRRQPSLRGGPAMSAALWQRSVALTGVDL